MNIRARHRENDEEKVARYINGLRYEIQYDISMITMRTVEYEYQVAMKVEEKLTRKKSPKNKGNNPNRGKGTNREKFQKSREEVSGSNSQKNKGENSRGGDSRGRRHFPRGIGRGRGG